MKRTIAILILLMVSIAYCNAYSESGNRFTLSELMQMFDNDSPYLAALFEETPDLTSSLTDTVSAHVSIISDTFSGIEYDATLYCTFIQDETCKSVTVSLSLSKVFPYLSEQFINEITKTFGSYRVEHTYFSELFAKYITENVRSITLEEIIQSKDNYDRYTLSFDNNISVRLHHLDQKISVDICKDKHTNINPIGAGMFIGDLYRNIINSSNVNILTEEDSKLTLYSQFISYPAYYELLFNEGQELTHAKVFVAGVYSMESGTYEKLTSLIDDVYVMVNEHKSDKLMRSTFRTNNEARDLNSTICVHEIKEEEGKVYHTLTFMPEEEYNQTLFLDYLNK